MPRKRRKGDVPFRDPAGIIRDKLPPPGSRPQRYHLPAAAWGGWFALTLERLQSLNPHLAAFTVREFLDFEMSWVTVMSSKSDPERFQWISEAFHEVRQHTRSLSRRGGFKTTGRKFAGPSDRWLLYARRLVKEGSRLAAETIAKANVLRHNLSY